MSPLYLYNGRLLTRSGGLAASEDCCCCPCENFSYYFNLRNSGSTPTILSTTVPFNTCPQATTYNISWTAFSAPDRIQISAAGYGTLFDSGWVGLGECGVSGNGSSPGSGVLFKPAGVRVLTIFYQGYTGRKYDEELEECIADPNRNFTGFDLRINCP